MTVETVRTLGIAIASSPATTFVEHVHRWVRERSGVFVCLVNVHLFETAMREPRVRAVLADAGACLPDGKPIALAASWSARRPVVRLAGADVFTLLCETEPSLRHYFFGSDDATLFRLVERVRERFPNAVIAGAHSPPFSPSLAVRDADISAINAAEPDIVWVGLGAPKQELWMAEARARLSAPVLLGVGAVFDFFAGTRQRAPRWMQRAGLEWLHRLFSEPGRLWRRYLVTNSSFVLRVVRAGISSGR
jgi:N-acetylglucosaminyldiphosphoundecaprenol N-acetyl-beta-D-mannosaminyltransferase